METSEQTSQTIIGGPEKSRAVYGYLADGVSDLYTFRSSENLSREVRLIVPAYAEHADFRPTLVLQADGVEIARAEDPGDLTRAREFEPFSLTWFWSGASANLSFEPGRDYAFRVEPGRTGDLSGRYVLVVGGPEEFSSADILETVLGLPNIWFGAYGRAPWRWNSLALIPLLVLAASVAAAGAVLRGLLRRARVSARTDRAR